MVIVQSYMKCAQAVAQAVGGSETFKLLERTGLVLMWDFDSEEKVEVLRISFPAACVLQEALSYPALNHFFRCFARISLYMGFV